MLYKILIFLISFCAGGLCLSGIKISLATTDIQENDKLNLHKMFNFTKFMYNLFQ